MFDHTALSRLVRLVTFGLLLVAQCALAKDALTLGIHPYKSPAKLIVAYTPLADYLAERLQQPVEIHISTDYQSHIDLAGADKLDIAYMGPSSYVSLVNQYGEKPLVARQAIKGRPVFQGIIFVPASSKLTSLSQLRGKRFAFGDPDSTMSHLVPRYMLWQAGVDADSLKEYKFLGSHDNVALSVLAGDYDAGAVKEAVFYKYADKGLKALVTTPSLSEHLFVTSTQLSEQQISEIREAFLDLKITADGDRIMAAIKPGITAWVPVQDTDYDNLRAIMNKLRELEVIQ